MIFDHPKVWDPPWHTPWHFCQGDFHNSQFKQWNLDRARLLYSELCPAAPDVSPNFTSGSILYIYSISVCTVLPCMPLKNICLPLTWIFIPGLGVWEAKSPRRFLKISVDLDIFGWFWGFQRSFFNKRAHFPPGFQLSPISDGQDYVLQGYASL